MSDCNLLIPLLVLFVLAMVWVVGYFFVYKQNKIDQDYEKFRMYWK